MSALRIVFFIIYLMSDLVIYAIFDTYRAHQLYKQGLGQESKALYQNMIIKNPKDWRALYDLGTILLNDTSYKDAISCLERALSVNSENRLIQERLDVAKKLLQEQEKQESEKQKQEKQQREQNEKDKDKEQSEASQNGKQKQEQEDHQQKQDNDNASNKQNNSVPQGGEQQGNDGQQQQEKKAMDNTIPEQRESSKKIDQEKNEMKDDAAGQAQQQQGKDTKAQSENALPSEDGRFSEKDKKILAALGEIDKNAQKQMVARVMASQKGSGHKAHGW